VTWARTQVMQRTSQNSDELRPNNARLSLGDCVKVGCRHSQVDPKVSCMPFSVPSNT
jgi:hypothetical protein